jgi:hypothetical protein
MHKQAIKKTLGKEHIEREEESTEGNTDVHLHYIKVVGVLRPLHRDRLPSFVHGRHTEALQTQEKNTQNKSALKNV